MSFCVTLVQYIYKMCTSIKQKHGLISKYEKLLSAEKPSIENGCVTQKVNSTQIPFLQGSCSLSHQKQTQTRLNSTWKIVHGKSSLEHDFSYYPKTKLLQPSNKITGKHTSKKSTNFLYMLKLDVTMYETKSNGNLSACHKH